MLGSSPYGPKFAAVNGMSAVFAHHMSPDLAFEALRDYRRRFEPRQPGAEPYSAMSVLAFASDDDEAVLDFEAAWTLTIAQPPPRHPRAAAAGAGAGAGPVGGVPGPAGPMTAGW